MDLSATLPTVHPKIEMLHSLGHTHVLNRAMINNIGAFGNMLLWSIFYPISRFQSKVGKLARSKTYGVIC